MSNRLLVITSVLLFLLSSQCNTIQQTTRKGASSESTYSSSTSQLRGDIIKYAKRQQGVKYKYGGRSPSGFDCSGFVHYVYDEFNITVTPVSRVQETEGRKIPLSDVQAGDLVFFRKTRAGSVFHVALVVANTAEGIMVVHSTTSRGVIVENISQSSYWKPKLSSARTFIR